MNPEDQTRRARCTWQGLSTSESRTDHKNQATPHRPQTGPATRAVRSALAEHLGPASTAIMRPALPQRSRRAAPPDTVSPLLPACPVPQGKAGLFLVGARGSDRYRTARQNRRLAGPRRQPRPAAIKQRSLWNEPPRVLRSLWRCPCERGHCQTTARPAAAVAIIYRVQGGVACGP